MVKYLKYLAVLLIVFMGLFLVWGWAPDMEPRTLAQKYATGASDFLSLPSGETAHYRLQGNEGGQKLVLLHGSNASLHTWEPWVEELENDFFILSLDLPGHGLTGPIKSNDYSYASMVSFVREVTEALSFERFILAGNSMGGGITAAFAIAHPDMLEAAVLLDASGIKLPDEVVGKRDLPLAFQLAGHWYSDWILKTITPRSIVSEGLSKSFTDQTLITEEMIDLYWELARFPGNREATAIRIAGYRDTPIFLPAEEISVPTLIIWGADDRLTPVDAAYEFQRRIGGSELVIFDGVGHIPMEEAAAESAAALKDFVLGPQQAATEQP